LVRPAFAHRSPAFGKERPELSVEGAWDHGDADQRIRVAMVVLDNA
jgi:hypothetical protein